MRNIGRSRLLWLSTLHRAIASPTTPILKVVCSDQDHAKEAMGEAMRLMGFVMPPEDYYKRHYECRWVPVPPDTVKEKA